MELSEFLQKKLNIDEVEANKIVECFKEYKQTYSNGHNHFHGDRNNNLNIYDMIVESKEEFEKNNSDLSNIHCNGCFSKCSITAPKCGRGKHIKDNLYK